MSSQPNKILSHNILLWFETNNITTLELMTLATAGDPRCIRGSPILYLVWTIILGLWLELLLWTWRDEGPAWQASLHFLLHDIINMYVYIYIYISAHRGYILRTGEILYVFTTSSMDMWQLAILILWIAWGGDFLWGLVVFGLHNFSHTDTASFRPRSQLVPVSIQILSHETLSGNNLCPLYGAIHRPLVVYVSAWKPASRNVKQLATCNKHWFETWTDQDFSSETKAGKPDSS